jgi:hypothetical protein
VEGQSTTRISNFVGLGAAAIHWITAKGSANPYFWHLYDSQ